MPLTPGTRLGPYEITAPLGKGGMGEVHRARDTRLDREVAIKVLPDVLARDPERLARFEREAKVLASLNHPNIATIFGLEEFPGGRAIAMELADGETLRCPVPLPEALRIAVQIAEALEAAHEKGITHRDLKPANIMVSSSGQVKVLDFGLAAVGRAPAGTGEESPTLTLAMTEAGVIMGTAAYMSPEQAAGKAVDKRADIWSFGVVLYEMLTGRRLFQGESVSHILADVLRGPIDLKALPAGTPAAVGRLLERCLERDPRLRLRDIGEARIVLGNPEANVQAEAPAKSKRGALVWAGAAFAALAVAAGGWLAGRLDQPTAAREVTRFAITLPPRSVVTGGAPAITHDGRSIAYAARAADGTTRLYVRRLDRLASTEVAGSDGAQLPFFSPDGGRVGFFAGGKLMIAPLEGGIASAIANVSYLPLGATWGEEDEIFYVPSLNSGILRIPASGGKPRNLTEPDGGAKGYAHTWPQYLSETQSLLFTVWGGRSGSAGEKVLLSIGNGKETHVPSPVPSSARYAASGHLLTSGPQGVTAGRFEPKTTREWPGQTFVLEEVFHSQSINTSWFAVSETGTLVYVPGNPSFGTLAWVDRGQVTPITNKPQAVDDFTLSPDGTRLATIIDLKFWVIDLKRGTRIRLTQLGEGNSLRAIWSRDGSQVIFASNREGDWDIYTAAANGGPAKRLLARPATQFPMSVAPDGTLLFSERAKGSASDLWTLSPGGEAAPLIVSQAAKVGGQFSPDGRMVAYVSDETGRDEVYLALVSKPGEAVAVSAEGGTEVMWSPGGKQLYYRRGDAFYSVGVTPGTLTVGETVKLLEIQAARGSSGNMAGYAVAADGRFLIRQPDPRAIPTQINVVLNWFEELRAKVSSR